MSETIPSKAGNVRTYDNLSTDEQLVAVEKATQPILEAICEGAIRFNDSLNGDDLQDRIDNAVMQADSMQTPWFVGEYVMEAAGEEITGMGRCDAEDALYPDADVAIIRL